MSSTKIRLRRLACTAGLALTGLAAFAAGEASGSGTNESKAPVCTARAQECMTAAEFRALTLRSAALNREYGLGSSE
jgi:hypothetical protein